MITTLGVYATHADAEIALRELKAFGITDSNISYVYADRAGDIVDNQNGDKVASSAGSGATTGAVLGAVAGFIVANGILPGLGSLFVAGPLATALGLTGAAATTVAGAMTGLAAGGLIGALSGMGVNEEDANMYQTLVKRGDVLVIAHSDSEETKAIFARTNAMEIREYRS